MTGQPLASSSLAVSVKEKLVLGPGQIVGLVGATGLGLTRFGLSLLVPFSHVGTVVVIDVRGWLAPTAAWELGVAPERLVIVRCDRRDRWPRVVAAALEGVTAVYAEIPKGVNEGMLRRLAAVARARRTGLALHPLRGGLPPGLTHWRAEAREVAWEGADRGHGRLTGRRLRLEVSGKSFPPRMIEVEDRGADLVCVDTGLATVDHRAETG